jgi:hypothetical protein
MTGAMLGRARTPWHLWAVGAVTLLFNAMGAFSYTATRLGMLAELGMTPEQIAFISGFPVWANAVWALGVWGALAGSLLILLRSRWAVWAMVVGTVGLVGTTLFSYVIADTPPEMQAPALDLTIWAVTLFLLVYAIRMTKGGVLR